MMRMSYLDYYKVILEKVRFDYGLVKKELHKANQVLTGEEQSRLRKWMLQNGLVFESRGPLQAGT
ncbi:hypothetical protein [Cyclobacterium xiamenense]|uniref:hypothetical protein n=1 Tax=Cyclobacterium xiamenense TaxID=1297121 RepID=UPI0035CEE5FA